jgi:hypothetical protein
MFRLSLALSARAFYVQLDPSVLQVNRPRNKVKARTNTNLSFHLVNDVLKFLFNIVHFKMIRKFIVSCFLLIEATNAFAPVTPFGASISTSTAFVTQLEAGKYKDLLLSVNLRI